MRYAFFPGCVAQTEQYGCGLSAREVLPRLGVELVDMPGSSCCGFMTYRISSPIGWKYLTARNLALAEKLGLDVLTLCNGCHLSFSQVKRDMEGDRELKKTIDQTLSIEGLEYAGECEAHHLLEVLHDRIGVDKIADMVTKPLKGLTLAAHPGCHSFRPSDLCRPDDAKDPRKLDDLIRALGADCRDYPEKLDCCGSHILKTEGGGSLKIAGSKLKSVKERGFDGLVTVCPLCFKALDGKQPEISGMVREGAVDIPVFYHTQLLGLSIGVSPERLGLHLNLSPVEGLLSHV